MYSTGSATRAAGTDVPLVVMQNQSPRAASALGGRQVIPAKRTDNTKATTINQ
jgi:hypothetical protein